MFNAAVYKRTPWTKCSQPANPWFTAPTVISPFIIAFLNCWFWKLQKVQRWMVFITQSSKTASKFLDNVPSLSRPLSHQPSEASAQPAKPVVPLRMHGTAGAAETGVVRVRAKSGVDYELAVGKVRLVHAFWRHSGTCSKSYNTVIFRISWHQFDTQTM